MGYAVYGNYRSRVEVAKWSQDGRGTRGEHDRVENLEGISRRSSGKQGHEP